MKFKDAEYGDLTGQIYDDDINVSEINLTSLEGAPKIVQGYFDCYNNKLTSLKYSPETVEGYFNCAHNKLTSLKYSPETVEGDFGCSYNMLTSLDGAPKIVKENFTCSFNNLESLKGSPEEVDGNFDCYGNPLTQFEIDKLVKIQIKGKISVPKGLIAPTKNDYRLYKKLGDKKYFKLKELKDKLK